MWLQEPWWSCRSSCGFRKNYLKVVSCAFIAIIFSSDSPSFGAALLGIIFARSKFILFWPLTPPIQHVNHLFKLSYKNTHACHGWQASYNSKDIKTVSSSHYVWPGFQKVGTIGTSGSGQIIFGWTQKDFTSHIWLNILFYFVWFTWD